MNCRSKLAPVSEFRFVDSGIGKRPVSVLILSAVAATALIANRPAGAASRVVHDTFEQYAAGATSSNGDCNVVSLSRDGVAGPYEGSKMAECNWDGIRKAANWADPLADLGMSYTFDFNSEYLVRMHFRTDNDVDRQEGSKYGRLGDNGGSWSCFHHSQDRLNMAWFSGNTQIGSTFWGNNGPFCTRDKWHTISYYIRLGSNGVIRIFFDGANVTEFNGNVTKSANGSPLNIMSNWSINGPSWAHDANNHIYWDKIEIFSDQGTGANGSFADNSVGGGDTAALPPPLGAPSNLKVIGSSN